MSLLAWLQAILAALIHPPRPRPPAVPNPVSVVPSPEPSPGPAAPTGPNLVNVAVEINKAREARDLPALSWDSRLGTMAEFWAKHLSFVRELNHDNFATRLGHAVGNVAGAENFASGQPTHEAVIYGPYDSIGVGAAVASDGTIYWCVDFAQLHP